MQILLTSESKFLALTSSQVPGGAREGETVSLDWLAPHHLQGPMCLWEGHCLALTANSSVVDLPFLGVPASRQFRPQQQHTP